MPWLQEGLPLESAPNNPESTEVTLTINEDVIATREYIEANLDNSDMVIWDARSPEEYRGEKVFAMRGGHIPARLTMSGPVRWTQPEVIASEKVLRQSLRHWELPEIKRSLPIARAIIVQALPIWLLRRSVMRKSGPMTVPGLNGVIYQIRLWKTDAGIFHRSGIENAEISRGRV